ncbi:CNNM domain-containing protein [Christensenellaceae bacterium OttesenSCG-928-L17]|nr:CNNM domain-containing protein [Christensenellaceae bacterium OttesenSCG-928-L17]
MLDDYWPYIFILFLIICSAFFSASEIAYASANRLRLKNACEEGNRRACWAHSIAENYAPALCTILLGNNLVNIAASSTATMIAISLVGEVGAAYATGIITVLILIFGEIVPKQAGKQGAERFALTASPLLRVLTILTKPIVWAVMRFTGLVSRLWGGKEDEHGMTADELVTIIETVEDEGVIDEERSDLLQSAIEFSEIEAQEIITHRMDMLALNIDDTLDEILETVLNAPYSRVPVYEESIDNILGVLPVNQLYKKLLDTRDIDIRGMLLDVCYVHKTLTLPVVLSEMQKRKLQLAVVVDEYGGTLGILTMEDILEELVGDIWDESDEIVEDFLEIEKNLYACSGTLSIYEFLDFFDLDDQDFEDEFTTMGGFAIDMLEGFPKEGDCFDYRGFRICVGEMSDLRVKQLLISPPESQEEQPVRRARGED